MRGAGTEFCYCLAFYGISNNLVTYLTGVLGQSNVAAARNVSTWQATCFLTPLAGAVVADSYWGRYRTMVVSCSVGVAVPYLMPLPTALHLKVLNQSSNITLHGCSPQSIINLPPSLVDILSCPLFLKRKMKNKFLKIVTG